MYLTILDVVIIYSFSVYGRRRPIFAGKRLGWVEWIGGFSWQSGLENWFRFHKQIGEPFHTAGHQWRRQFIHLSYGGSQACLPFLEV
jgi:hypothetical protein